MGKCDMSMKYALDGPEAFQGTTDWDSLSYVMNIHAMILTNTRNLDVAAATIEAALKLSREKEHPNPAWRNSCSLILRIYAAKWG